MYRADYVKLHYVHYSTITILSQLSEKETIRAGEYWTHRYFEPHAHEVDEEMEATMLHTKSKVEHNTVGWKDRCKQHVSSKIEGHCSLGFPFPKDHDPYKQTNLRSVIITKPTIKRSCRLIQRLWLSLLCPISRLSLCNVGRQQLRNTAGRSTAPAGGSMSMLKVCI